MIVEPDASTSEASRARASRVEDTNEQLREDGVFAWIGLHEPNEEEFDLCVASSTSTSSLSRTRSRRISARSSSSRRLAFSCQRRPAGDRGELAGDPERFVGKFIVSVRHGDCRVPRGSAARWSSGPTCWLAGPARPQCDRDRVVDDYDGAWRSWTRRPRPRSKSSRLRAATPRADLPAEACRARPPGGDRPAVPAAGLAATASARSSTARPESLLPGHP